jgi:hypothetical protein
VPWTVEQVVALAPDPSAARAGRDLANPRRWSRLGLDEASVWGECKSSAAQPYRACVDLAACTPDLFPELMAAALSGRDLNQWAAARELV